MAKALVKSYGMSKLGYRVFEDSSESFTKNYSEETDRLIDNEVNNIINECIEKTRMIVRQYKEQIEKISIELLDKETIDVLDIMNLIGERPFPMPKSMQAYIEETKERKRKLQEELEETERLEKERLLQEEQHQKEKEELKEELEKEKNNKI